MRTGRRATKRQSQDPTAGALRVITIALALISIGCVAEVLTWAGGNPLGYGHTFASADFDVLLVRCLSVAGWLALAWLTLAIMLEAATALPGAIGNSAHSVADYLTPKLLRKLLQAALGVSVLAGPLAASSAMAVDRSPVVATASPTTSAPPAQLSLDRPESFSSGGPTAGLPSLDRASAPTPTSSITPKLSSGAPPAESSLPYVAPAPPPPRNLADVGSAALLSGSAHRALDDNSYVVRRGDALWDIAARHLGSDATAADIARAWPRWYATNRAVIGADPSVIRPGEILHQPRT